MRLQLGADYGGSKHIGGSRNRGKRDARPIPSQRPTARDPARLATGEYEVRG